MASTRTAEIAKLNDAFRKGDPSVPGQRFVTAGVVHLLNQLEIPVEQLIQRVTQFDGFTQHNDPHAQHDFAAFEFHGHQLFWKIDAYDQDYKMGSDDPTDLSKTRRVLTIMLAEDGEPLALGAENRRMISHSTRWSIFALMQGEGPLQGLQTHQ